MIFALCYSNSGTSNAEYSAKLYLPSARPFAGQFLVITMTSWVCTHLIFFVFLLPLQCLCHAHLCPWLVLEYHPTFYGVFAKTIAKQTTAEKKDLQRKAKKPSTFLNRSLSLVVHSPVHCSKKVSTMTFARPLCNF